MRFKSVFAVLIVLAMVAAACGDSSEDDGTASGSCDVADLTLVTDGVLTIATGEPVFPPWMIDDDPTNQQGFEGAVAYAIANEMGFTDDQVTWIRVGFDAAIAPGPKDFDFNIQQYSITPARAEVVTFSDPYYTTNQALVAYSDSPVVNASNTADLKQYKLGAAIGTTSLAYIENVIEPDTPAAVYDTNADAKSGLDAGQVDALVFDLPTAFYITAVEIPDSTIVGQLEAPDEAADNFGLLFAKDNPLAPCANEAIKTLQGNGTIESIEAEWLSGGGDIKTIEQ
jgi:polar amino acid transport system substrate-binding protein